ncbi:amidohydrolase [Streptomyces sp. NPDC002790]|uniref:amidohydrolase n=1 Tax=Streptomyces sp. NPDC002790 TaxID=3154431 RepID=UPI0033338D99
MTRATDTVLKGLDEIRPWVEGAYKDLHAHPELGFQEHRTAAKVAEALRADGYEVTEGIGGTGLIGVRRGGDGPTVMLRADLDALPVAEATGLPYASTATGQTADGTAVPVMHACGHDVHVASMLGFARLMAWAPEAWRGTLVVLFQPDEENGSGADAMVADGLVERSPRPDVVLAQHVLPYPAGGVGTRSGSFLSAADSTKVTLYGRGAHGSMPQHAIDPVVMAAMVVVRLQTVVSRELAAATPAVLTVGSITAGTGPNVIPDRAELQLNVRTYDEDTRAEVRAAVERIVRAEATASGATRDPEFETLAAFPATVNDEAPTRTVADAFTEHFGARAHTIDRQSASEDMSRIPEAFGVPFTYWGIGGTDPAAYEKAVAAGSLTSDIPVNHSPYFAPVLQPTLDTGVRALTAAALAWLAAPEG